MVMRLHEYEGVNIFESAGIRVPRRGVARTAPEAVAIAEEIGYPVVVKAQVLVGGRGLAGGVKSAADPEDLKSLSEKMLESEIKGLPVEMIMVTEKLNIADELYAAVTMDGYSGRPVVVASTEGGVHIEEVAEKTPDRIVSVRVDPRFGFYPYQARNLLRKLGLENRLLLSFADVLVRLYKVFSQLEGMIVEINPLAVLEDGKLCAVDAVLEVDNSALKRIAHELPNAADRMDNPLERKGKQIGVTYVDLDGDIGIISSGAGLGMASMDIIGQKLRPANFLETGGGITEDLLYKCMDLVMAKQGLKGIFINVYGGINPIHEGAKGVVRYVKEHGVDIPIVAKALGNRQEETWETLESGGVHVVTDVATEKAVERLFELVGDRA
jgi:succinyl-CoA synthetase beta subunit